MSITTDQIFAVLRAYPDGVTSSEMARHTNSASYNVTGRLSKLAAYGFIERVKIGKGSLGRYRMKVGTVAIEARS